jgi:hypothetical protein
MVKYVIEGSVDGSTFSFFSSSNTGSGTGYLYKHLSLQMEPVRGHFAKYDHGDSPVVLAADRGPTIANWSQSAIVQNLSHPALHTVQSAVLPAPTDLRISAGIRTTTSQSLAKGQAVEESGGEEEEEEEYDDDEEGNRLVIRE